LHVFGGCKNLRFSIVGYKNEGIFEAVDAGCAGCGGIKNFFGAYVIRIG
jgi:hypothetical protein